MPKPPSSKFIAAELLRVCHTLSERRFVAATDGNVSARLKNGHILTTRTCLCKGEATLNDLVEVDAAGGVIRGRAKPSTELLMHLFIYRHRPDAGAVVHAHPVYATGFAAAGLPIPGDVFPEVAAGIGDIPLAAYTTPGTQALAESLAPFIETSCAILLQNHGLVTFGSDLREAWFRMEKVEHAAKTLFIARLLGGEKRLPITMENGKWKMENGK